VKELIGAIGNNWKNEVEIEPKQPESIQSLQTDLCSNTTGILSDAISFD
jgi:hypothetical protein